MKIKNGISLLVSLIALLISACTDTPSQAPLGTANPNLTSFNVIKDISIAESEKK
jgi:hypothetical protein